MADWHTTIRERDFPMLEQAECDGKAVIYLDNAATTQCARPVQWALESYWKSQHANVYRGAYCLSRRAGEALEETRQVCAEFLGASSGDEIVFTGGATASANLLADAFALTELKPGDLVLATEMEHHSNLLPWREACRRTGAELALVPVTGEGELDLAALDGLLERGPKLLTVTAVSNVLGTVNPLEEIVSQAHRAGCAVAVDAAQAMRCSLPGVDKLDCDFLAFSGHKMYGPTGVGVLYGKYEVLDSMPPWHGGGEMIKNVTFEKTTYADVPARFEAGTPMIAEVIGLGKAIEWINAVGIENIRKHEEEITNYALEQLAQIPQVKIFGNPKERGALISVTLDGIAVSDAAMILDEENVAVRSGHHCAQPVMDRFGVDATLRLSFGAYTLKRDIDRFIAGIKRVLRLFG